MPKQAQLGVWERRDNSDRNDLANSALALCRAIKAMDGVTSSRFYWYTTDTIVIWTEGEASAFDYQPEPNVGKAMFAMSDLAKLKMSWRLSDAKLGEELFKASGK